MNLIRDVGVFMDDGNGNTVLIGSLRPSYMGGRNLASTSFVYNERYLARQDAYAISPELPLGTGRQYTADSHDIFGAFADASPDAWGRKIVEANHAIRLKQDPLLPRTLGAFDFLVGVSDRTRMGNLRLRDPDATGWLSNGTTVAEIHDLKKVIAAAQRYEANEASEADLAYLSDIATSPGGARPKANVLTEDGRLALAKLPHSKDGTIDVESWEALALIIARRVGLATPPHQHIRASEETSVLVVERFDRTARGHRLGYMSAATAMELGVHNDTSTITYQDFADTIAEVSAAPEADLIEMFGRIALTILINNVDDHWKNHGFLRHPAGWRLAPLFDINPSNRHGSINSRPISPNDDPRARDIRNLSAIAENFGLATSEADGIIRTIAIKVARWPSIATSLGISSRQQKTMASAFDEKQLAHALNLTAAGLPRTVSAEDPPTATGEVWVKPHMRHGATIAGYWRNGRNG
jgi:serine/threonine-protein kinase HipA